MDIIRIIIYYNIMFLCVLKKLVFELNLTLHNLTIVSSLDIVRENWDYRWPMGYNI